MFILFHYDFEEHFWAPRHQLEETRTGRKAKRDLDLDKVSTLAMKRKDQKFQRRDGLA